MKKIILLLLTIFSLNSWADSKTFVVPDSLKNQVEFWTKIYSEFDSNQVVFFHQDDPRVIYYVMDLPKIENEISSPKFVSQVKEQYAKIEKILSMASELEKLKDPSDLEQKIFKVLKKYNLEKNSGLPKALRNQNGLKSQYAFGLKASGKYIDDMRAVLRAHSVPEELIAVVFVESLFYISATSHAGASGPWGIVKETALSSGIHVNNFVDERLDPVVATIAASTFLKKAKDGLGEWPLALTAYNYGYSGMLRAVANLSSTDISDIIAKHDSPIFGYASKNYYAEFLAALQVFENHQKYFPNIVSDSAWSYDLVQVLRPVDVKDLLAVNAITLNDLRSLNPAITKRTLNGQEILPADYSLRVPKGKSQEFYSQLKKLPEKNRQAAHWKISSKYLAPGHENIQIIAKKFDINSSIIAEKLQKSIYHKPKGALLIRSHAYNFSQLKDVAKKIVQAVIPAKVASTNP